jgi:V/A-type H+-transporting ATPase subunit A
MFDLMLEFLRAKLDLSEKGQARSYFYQIRQKMLDLNSTPWNTEALKDLEKEIRVMLEEKKLGATERSDA